MSLEPHDILFAESVDQLRDWFDANHKTAAELWLGGHRKATGVPSVAWSDSVDEALCVGWIDGIRKSLDERRYAQRFTPRRKGSTWSAINVAKVAALTEQGRMRAAGIAAFEARTAANTAIYAYEREHALFSAEEDAAFRANEAAWADWERRAPSYRKVITRWVVDAKQATTRERRFTKLLEDSAAGRPVGPMSAAKTMP
jgi:uncharacterized protein YdeI (YjbR/CyaY-like superfamily)